MFRCMYCNTLVQMKLGSQARHVFDRALRALPLTQHEVIWDIYIPWVKDLGVPETAVRVFRRYLMYDASRREDFVSYLEEIGQYEEAARQLSLCVNDDHYVSPSGSTKHQLWMRLCDLCAAHPNNVSSSLNVEAIIRSGIQRFSDEVGRLWTRLADYYIRAGQFEKARDVYEEAIHAVITVRDFTVVFDAYAKFEESMLMAKMNSLEEDEDDDDEANDIELRMARLEYLMDQRPLLLSSVVLRQNPHNVHEWHKRIKLFKDDARRTLMAYTDAVKTVDPKKATGGKLNSLWLSFAWYYETHGDLNSARVIMKKATEVSYKSIDELATVWCSWAEMELKHENYNEALNIMQQAVLEPASSIKRRRARAAAEGKGMNAEDIMTVHDRLYKNVKVWGLYLDLEESLGTVETTRAAYDRVMDIKVITPQMVLNFAKFLEENDYFEDSFKVFERAVAMFSYPHVKIIWLTYIDKFIERYEGKKLERLRDIFEQSLVNVPEEDAAEFYIKYAKAEEQFGLARHAMAVYDRATKVVPEARKLDIYRLYIRKVEKYYGVTKTRPIYERGIAELNDDMARELCLEYAEVERKLGEIDRARAVLQHGSQFADPKKEVDYWKKWREFEEMHGNEDTFRDMLRIKRSVATAFSQVLTFSLSLLTFSHTQTTYLAAEMLADSAPEAVPGSGVEAIARNAEIEAMERAAETSKRKFVPSSDNEPRTKVSKVENPEEIDIDEDLMGDVGITQKAVPAAVFGSLQLQQQDRQRNLLDKFT